MIIRRLLFVMILEIEGAVLDYFSFAKIHIIFKYGIIDLLIWCISFIN